MWYRFRIRRTMDIFICFFPKKLAQYLYRGNLKEYTANKDKTEMHDLAALSLKEMSDTANFPEKREAVASDCSVS